MAFPTFPTVGSTIKTLSSGSTAPARLNMTRFRALHGPAITPSQATARHEWVDDKITARYEKSGLA